MINYYQIIPKGRGWLYMNKIKEKIKVLLEELDKKPDLSFRASLINIAVGIATSEGLISKDEMKDKTIDEQIDVLKKQCQ